jgi:hypothetical protein
MSGQLVVYQSVWMAQRRGPAIQLHLQWPDLTAWPKVAAAVRIGMGAAMGALVGATTSYFGLWVAIGAAIGWGGHWIMSRLPDDKS